MKRNRIAFLKPEQPPFIRKIKEKLCYQESATVETKKEQLDEVTENDLGDRSDEKPTVVIEQSDVSKEVADNYIASLECTNEKSQQRMIFKKPVKKEGEARNAMLHSTSKKALPERNEQNDNSKRRRTSNDTKSVKNSSLLSFNEEEEEC